MKKKLAVKTEVLKELSQAELKKIVGGAFSASAPAVVVNRPPSYSPES